MKKSWFLIIEKSKIKYDVDDSVASRYNGFIIIETTDIKKEVESRLRYNSNEWKSDTELETQMWECCEYKYGYGTIKLREITIDVKNTIISQFGEHFGTFLFLEI